MISCLMYECYKYDMYVSSGLFEKCAQHFQSDLVRFALFAVLPVRSGVVMCYRQECLVLRFCLSLYP